jgi:iron(III) transport system ATP-binding protein
VTHDQEEALSLADTVAVLREGTIVQGGTPDQLYTRPVDVGLAQFLGAVNLIDADFEPGIARTALGPLALRPLPGAPDASAPSAGRGTVMVRPEQLEVRAQGESAADGTARASGSIVGATSGLAGEVEQCRYYGHDALLHIRLEALDGGKQVLLARVQGEQALAAGTPVLLAAHGPVTIVQ